MSRHRAQPPPRYQPRYGRMVVLGLSLLTSAVAVLGGIGVLPSAADGESGSSGRTDAAVGAVGISSVTPDRQSEDAAPSGEPSTEVSAEVSTEPETPRDPVGDAQALDETTTNLDVPVDSGSGRRVIFSESEQRVWLVNDGEHVKRTYLVSGSLTDNLDPGSFEVYSRSEDATGIEDSGTMKWFVRFTQGDTGAAIGFHSIPVDEGQRVQTKAQLGTPLSHGCIRQKTVDAKALWDFAPLGTTVVVVP